ncbi:hypothetical protein DY000_02029258 [Brassica cretica]|uniref:Kinesin motor domain-containing protein n=1 Tax=Brassica cretica TaxID=69181 RepID=A0ABQ7DMZ0_BRACR|nr:hypothetical protein DY000_02029258 [Brassica cretica]
MIRHQKIERSGVESRIIIATNIKPKFASNLLSYQQIPVSSQLDGPSVFNPSKSQVKKERMNAVSKIRFVFMKPNLRSDTYGLACVEKHKFVFYDMLDGEVSKDEVSRDILRLMHYTYRNQGFQLFLSFFEIHGGKRYDLLKERKSVEKRVVILFWLLCT